MKKIIFSCDTDKKKLTKEELDIIFGMLFNAGMRVVPAIGVYKGQVENSFICDVETNHQEKLIIALAGSHFQESWLEVQDDTAFAFLNFTDGSMRRFLGKWHVAPNNAPRMDNFTINMNDMKVYKCG